MEEDGVAGAVVVGGHVLPAEPDELLHADVEPVGRLGAVEGEEALLVEDRVVLRRDLHLVREGRQRVRRRRCHLSWSAGNIPSKVH